MSCPAPPKLLSYYSNKVNIYNNPSFIPLPTWRACPPPPCIYLTPQVYYTNTPPPNAGCPQPLNTGCNPCK